MLLVMYIINAFTEPVTEEGSLDVNMSTDLMIDDSDVSDDQSELVSQALLRKKFAQIPDFVGLLYAQSIINRKTPLIVEIKPIKYSSPHAYRVAVTRMVFQTLLQARFAFEAYCENQTIHILCVVGMYWAMYSLNRKDLELFPNKWGSEKQQSDEAKAFLKKIRDRLVVCHLLNDRTTAYSNEFQRAWNEFATNNGLPRAFTQTIRHRSS